jgi:hypothetical protein
MAATRYVRGVAAIVPTVDPLTPRQVAALLRASASAVRAELEALPRQLAAWHPRLDEWCALQVLGHLIESERRAFAERIERLLREDCPRLETWDQDVAAESRNDCDRDPAELLEEFVEAREASIGMVAGLQPAELEREGEHPLVGRLSVAELLHQWVRHDRDHLKQLLSIVQMAVERHLGNAARL